MTRNVLVGYQVMDKHSGIWFFVRELPIALAYHDMEYKVRTCVAVEFDPEGARNAVSTCDRQYNQEIICELPDQGAIPSYREPDANSRAGD